MTYPGHIPGPNNGEPGERQLPNGEPGEDPFYFEGHQVVDHYGSPTIGQQRAGSNWMQDYSAGWTEIGEGAAISGRMPPGIPEEEKYLLSRPVGNIAGRRLPAVQEYMKEVMRSWAEYGREVSQLNEEVAQELVGSGVEPDFKFFKPGEDDEETELDIGGWELYSSESDTTKYTHVLLSDGGNITYMEDLGSENPKVFQISPDRLAALHSPSDDRTTLQRLLARIGAQPSDLEGPQGSITFEDGSRISALSKSVYDVGCYLGWLRGLLQEHGLDTDVSFGRVNQLKSSNVAAEQEEARLEALAEAERREKEAEIRERMRQGVMRTAKAAAGLLTALGIKPDVRFVHAQDPADRHQPLRGWVTTITGPHRSKGSGRNEWTCGRNMYVHTVLPYGYKEVSVLLPTGQIASFEVDQKSDRRLEHYRGDEAAKVKRHKLRLGMTGAMPRISEPHIMEALMNELQPLADRHQFDLTDLIDQDYREAEESGRETLLDLKPMGWPFV